MEKTRRLFISDIHLGAGEVYDWYNPQEHQERLLGFLDSEVLEKSETIKDLILLGDIFDIWVCPPDRTPPTFNDIFKNNRQVLDKFREVIKSDVHLYLAHGNHDFNLTPDEIKAEIPGIIVIQDTTYYMTGRIRAEHGHIHTLFNKPDWKSDLAFGRPIGYFIARLVTRPDGVSDYKSFRSIISYVDDLIEAGLSPQTLFSSVLEGLAERAGVKKVKMPDGKSISIEDLKERYAYVEDSPLRIARKILDEYDLGIVADSLCKKYGHRIVIFGHTHRAKFDKDSFLLSEDRVYVNSGAWCEKQAHFVEVDKKPDSKTVVLHEVDEKGRSKNQGGVALSSGTYEIISS